MVWRWIRCEILREFEFRTTMLLPSRDVVDQPGIAAGIRQLVDVLEMPLVLYIKFDRWLDPPLFNPSKRTVVISWIKYAVVRDDPADDDYLREILDVFPAERIVSGIGEQPAIIHLRDFGVTGFTSGCVCVAPEQSTRMLRAIQDADYETAERFASGSCRWRICETKSIPFASCTKPSPKQESPQRDR